MDVYVGPTAPDGLTDNWIPTAAKGFWLMAPFRVPTRFCSRRRGSCLVLYDNQTRSMLQTDQQFPSIGSQKKRVAIKPDTSVDVYFGPTPPPGKESNWVQTWPGKGWNVILRLWGRSSRSSTRRGDPRD